MNGKGGTGKTTFAALFMRYLISRKKGSVLAIDADPNSSLAELLGVMGAKTIVGMIDDISKNLDKIPPGIPKDRFIEMKVQSEGLTEEKDFDLLMMGRPEGPGCYCYVNSLLRDIIARITRNYDFVIIDNAAGMEHISRRTTRSLGSFVVVSDYSVFGVRSARRIYDLAKELDITIERAFLVLNKVTDSAEPLEREVEATGLSFAGTVPYSDEIVRMSVAGRPVFEMDDKRITGSVGRIAEKILNG